MHRVPAIRTQRKNAGDTRPAGQSTARPRTATLPARARSPFAPARKVPEMPGAGQLPRDRSSDSPGSYTRADLGREPTGAAQARRLTRTTLARWGLHHLTDEAETIASELASNAINAAVAPSTTLPAIIFAVHRRPEELRIIVWDNGPGQPAITEPGHDAETGRGLAIIDDFTGQNWGWWPTPRSGGKVVWAALPAP
jgi:anti-sigma regulatory factor (Ser/Thr protein kinase)